MLAIFRPVYGIISIAALVMAPVSTPLVGGQVEPQQSHVATKSKAAEQPLPFSHKTHVVLDLPCKFCHTNPEPGSQMTLPETAKCMTCHATIAKDKPTIQQLTAFYNSKKPVPWVQVYSVPGFVYWSHRTHTDADLKCESCHGDVGQMDTMARVTNVTNMAGCVECHRASGASTGCQSCHETQSSRWMLPRSLQDPKNAEAILHAALSARP